MQSDELTFYYIVIVPMMRRGCKREKKSMKQCHWTTVYVRQKYHNYINLFFNSQQKNLSSGDCIEKLEAI